MKKTISVCMTAVMALSLLAGGAVQAYALSAETVEPVSAVAEENCISSSWKRASDPALTEKDILAHCKANLTGYKVPKFVEFRDELPKTNVGKILRRELKDAPVDAAQ